MCTQKWEDYRVRQAAGLCDQIYELQEDGYGTTVDNFLSLSRNPDLEV